MANGSNLGAVLDPVTGPAQPGTTAAPASGGINLSQYASQYPASVISAAQQIFASQPDQASTFQTQYGGNLSAWLNSFTQWWSNYGSQVANNMQPYQPEANLLSALGYSQGGGGNWVAGQNAVVQAPPLGSTAPGSVPVVPTVNQPTEQGIYNEAIGGLNNQVLNDANLAQDTTQLENNVTSAGNQLGGVLESAIAPPGGTSQVTQQENAAAQTAANTQINALTQSIQSMQGNLQGALAQQAAALLQSLQQVQANINQYGSSATQALMTQINTQLGDLQTSIQSQQTALNTQIQALSGAADTASQQQLSALQTQLSQLNTAEAPVAQARTQAAQAQVTAVNIGEAQAQNQIRGQAALQGFVGGSSMEDNAISQSGIAAAQAGAADVGTATLENAQDYQGIGDFGANQQASIADTLAQQQQAITGQGATGTMTLADALATGTQNLQDTGASGAASIANTVAGQQETAGNTAAETGYTNTAAGIAASNTLADQLAGGTAALTSTEAQQEQQNINNQYGQETSAGLALAALPSQEAGSIASIDNLQNTGLLDAQNALNWWNSPAATPTPTTTTSVAPTTGNQIATAGAGLLGAATQIGNSNNWWQSPSTSTSTTSGVSTTTPFTDPTITVPSTTLIPTSG